MSRRVIRALWIGAASALLAGGLSTATASATGSPGWGWPTVPAHCAAPLSPVVPKPGVGYISTNTGCARLICPIGYAPISPYQDGSSAVFYSIAHAVYQVIKAWDSLVGCTPSGSTAHWHPIGSLPSWIDDGLCRLYGLPTYSDLAKRRG
jgi:hypothetical protein